MFCQTDPMPYPKIVQSISQQMRGRAILKAGFNHDDESVCQRAEETQENLLRKGYLSFLDLDA